MLHSIRKKIQSIPDYIAGFRILFGLRLFLRNIFTFPVVIKTKSGSWIFLGLDKLDDVILRHLNTSFQKVYFPAEIQLSKGDVVLDVGAHHGIFAMELSSRYPDISIFSFEPDKTSFRYLRINKRLNRGRNITVINVGLDATSGTAFIVKSEEGSWGNFVIRNDSHQAEKIQTLSVANFIDQYEISEVKYIKINAEGAEFILLPEIFRLKIFPVYILLFAHPEQGNIKELIQTIYNQSYVMVRATEDPVRPWFLLMRMVDK